MPRFSTTLAFVLLLPSQAFAQGDWPSSRDISIESVRTTGIRCPAGSVATNLSDDGTAMTLLFDEFIAELGEGTRRRILERCTVDIKMNVPPGWSMGLFCVDVRGYADLDATVSASQTINYHFGQGAPREIANVSLEGPFSDDYENFTQIPVQSINWSPCDRRQQDLSIITHLSLQREHSDQLGLMTVDSLDGELKHHYGIMWRQCEPETYTKSINLKYFCAGDSRPLDQADVVRSRINYFCHTRTMNTARNFGRDGDETKISLAIADEDPQEELLDLHAHLFHEPEVVLEATLEEDFEWEDDNS